MNSKALTGLLLAVGPILMAVAIFGFPGTGSGDEGTAVIVGKIAENIGLHRVGTLFELAGLVAMMTGWIFLAQAMNQNGKPGSLFAKVATILPLICLPIAVASTGLALSVGWAIEDGLMTVAGLLYGASEGVRAGAHSAPAAFSGAETSAGIRRARRTERLQQGWNPFQR